MKTPIFAATTIVLAGFVQSGSSHPHARVGAEVPAIRATIDGPDKIAFDAAGSLFVYESSGDGPSAIQEISADGQKVATLWVGCDRQQYSSDPAAESCLGAISAMHVEKDDKVLLVQETKNRLLSFDPHSKTFSSVAGNGGLKFSGDGGPAVAAGIFQPSCAFMDRAGNIFVCDWSGRIRRIDAGTGIIMTIAGTGGHGFGGDGGPALDAEFDFLGGIAVDAAGNLFIADDHTIRRVDGTTGIIETIAGTGRDDSRFGFDVVNGPALKADLFTPADLTLDGRGNLFFLNANSRICKIELKSGILTTIAGRSKPGFSGDRGLATRAYIDAWSLALDPHGNLFFADGQHNRIRRIDLTTGIITTFAGNGRPRRRYGPPIL